MALIAFGAAFAVMTVTGTNRTPADLYLGIAGYAATLGAAVSFVLMLALTIRGRGPGACWLALTAIGLMARCGAGFGWLAAHLV